ncbi:MAG TPA: MauE/DoxX family redox-associated membrane protein [Chitinophagaceae bacterium]
MKRSLITSIMVFVYTYTALSKLLHVKTNVSVLHELPLLNYFAPFLAFFIPLAELSLVILLLVPARNKQALYLSLGMLAVFTIYLITALIAGFHLPCTCGGVLEKLSWRQHVLFNLFLIAFNVVAIRCKSSSRKPQQSSKEIHA